MFAEALRRGDKFIPENWVAVSRPIDRAIYVDRIDDKSVAVRFLGGGYDPHLVYKIALTSTCLVFRLGL